MKNINMTINSNAITSLSPPTQPPPYVPKQQIYSVSFSVQFEDEAEAIKLASKLLSIVTGDSN